MNPLSKLVACIAISTLSGSGAFAQTTIEGTGPYGGSFVKKRSFSDGAFNATVERNGHRGSTFRRDTKCFDGQCESSWTGVTGAGRPFSGSGKTVFDRNGSTTHLEGTGPFGGSWQRKIISER